MSKHTPGPWMVETDVVQPNDVHVFAKDMLGIAIVDSREYPEDTGTVPREVGLANARLIAAAPELLEACKAALAGFKQLGFQIVFISTIEAAIAKAEGAQGDRALGELK
jgi:hypothetical protein